MFADTDQLIASFRASLYVIAPHRCLPAGLSLRVDAPAPQLSALFAAFATRHCSLLTAVNPQAQAETETANRLRQQALLRDVQALGLPALPAHSAAPCIAVRVWQEPMVCVPGLSPAEAATLARRYGQLAWLQVGADCVPQLHWCTPVQMRHAGAARACDR